MTKPISRRDFGQLALGVAAAPLGACSHAQGKGAPVAQPLRLGFIGIGEQQPIGAEGWAYKRGLLAPVLHKLGFSDVSFLRFVNGPDLNEALSGGSLDVGIYGDTPALVGRAAGLPTRLLNQSVVGLDAWLLVRADGPRSLAELAGKTVATSKGSYMNRYLSGLLLEKGLNDSVKFAHLLPSDAAAALERGDIAAYAAPVQTAPLMVGKGARVLDRASDHSGLVGSSVTVLTNQFAKGNPDFSTVWNDLRAQAVADLKKNLEAYYAFHAETVHVPIEIAKVSHPVGVFVGEPLSAAGLALLEGTKRFLVGQKLAQADFSISAWALTEALPAR